MSKTKQPVNLTPKGLTPAELRQLKRLTIAKRELEQKRSNP